MSIVPPPSHTCPECGQPAVASAVRQFNGYKVGDYRDAAGHIWESKWFTPAGAA